MSLVTLKRFLTTQDDDAAPWRPVWLLLQGMSLHTVEAGRADFDTFRAEMEQLQALANEESDAHELLSLATSANKALADYEQRAERFFNQRSAMLANMLSLAIGAIADRDCSKECAGRLQEIDARLSGTVAPEDLQELSLQLERSLKEVQRASANRSNIAGTEQEQPAGANVAATPVQPSSPWSADPNTGLPAELAAKAAFEENLKNSERRFLVVAVVNRIQSINARFGREVGDQVLKAIAEFFQSRLYPSDRLFRWRGPALIALVEREKGIDSVRADIRRISQSYIEKPLQIAGRRVMVPLSASWLVLPLGSSVGETTRKIDKFIASQRPEYVDTPPGR